MKALLNQILTDLRQKQEPQAVCRSDQASCHVACLPWIIHPVCLGHTSSLSICFSKTSSYLQTGFILPAAEINSVKDVQNPATIERSHVEHTRLSFTSFQIPGLGCVKWTTETNRCWFLFLVGVLRKVAQQLTRSVKTAVALGSVKLLVASSWRTSL